MKINNASTTTFKPFYNPPPSDFIEEELEARGWTQEDLADILGYTPQTINKLLTGKSSITPSFALALGKAFDQTPQFWLNLESLYQIHRLSDEKADAEVAYRRQIYEVMPINEMHKKGWISKPKLYEDFVSALAAFWRNKSNWLDKLQNQGGGSNEIPIYRKSEARESNFDPKAAYCWFQMAKNVSEGFSIPVYDAERLAKLLSELPQYTVSPTGVADALEELKQCGILFFVLTHLKHTYIDGAAFLHNDKRVIVCTIRYKRLNNFWFTLAHEIAHHLKHINESNKWIIDVEKAEINQQEEEANAMAGEALRHSEIIEMLGGATHYLKSTQIEKVAEEIGVHPCIVVGAMAYHSEVHFRRLNEFNTDPLLVIPDEYQVEKQL